MNSGELLTEMLLRSENYRDFLIEAFAHLKQSKFGFSLASLAQKIGCRSKSYPHEVMTGRRNLSLDYAPGFANAFGLKGDGRKLFLKFVEVERSVKKATLQKEIQELKQRMQSRTEHVQKKPQDVFSQSIWIDVYAALGDPERGASFDEIQGRTGLKAAALRALLQAMGEKALVRIQANPERFLPGVLNHFFEVRDPDLFFKNRFLELLRKVETKAQKSMVSEKDLFQCSTISVLSQDLPKMKKELRELINRFAQDAEVASGDQIAHLVVSLIS